MKKIVILGCENSHANSFLGFIRDDKHFADVEVVGVYSDEQDAMERVAKEFNVPTMENYDSAVGKVDGVVITARHGDNHYKYAAPYIPSGVPMFIDKPITVSESDALAFAKALKDNGVQVTGGSSCKYDKTVLALKADAENKVDGDTVGGFVACPLNSKMGYGGFYFYSQHLVEVLSEIFGRFPKSVKAYVSGENVNVVFRYENYDVNGLFAEGCFRCYYAARTAKDASKGGALVIDSSIFLAEWEAFYALMNGGKSELSYEEFIAPVFVLNAIERSMQSGNEEEVKKIKL
ncbi:MAG: Gfo/Idh/MocA family oxidoreductase [Clostridia bacterium]|nr:Gfo/Idh/MocA family oxidoreductase [Clostridia bacterium]